MSINTNFNYLNINIPIENKDPFENFIKVKNSLSSEIFRCNYLSNEKISCLLEGIELFFNQHILDKEEKKRNFCYIETRLCTTMR